MQTTIITICDVDFEYSFECVREERGAGCVHVPCKPQDQGTSALSLTQVMQSPDACLEKKSLGLCGQLHHTPPCLPLAGTWV